MTEKIKTTEEIKAELADKKIGKTYLAEFENGIKKELDGFKAVLFDFKPKHEVSYVLDTKEIKSLNTALNEVISNLEKISIPNQIEVIERKENKITFSDATTKWLTWFCSIAFILAVGGVIYGINAYQNVTRTNAESFERGIFEGRKHIYNISPPAGKSRIDKNYPNWKTVR